VRESASMAASCTCGCISLRPSPGKAAILPGFSLVRHWAAAPAVLGAIGAFTVVGSVVTPRRSVERWARHRAQASQCTGPPLQKLRKRPLSPGILRMIGSGTELAESVVSSGWPTLDRIYRILPGDLTVVTGLPGSGKSEWLLSLMTNLAKLHHWRILICGLEATQFRLTRQLLEKCLAQPLEKAELKDADVVAWLAWLDEHFCWAGQAGDEPSLGSLLEVASQRANSREGLQGVVIDSHDCIHRSGSDNEALFIKDSLSRLKDFADQTGCHVWIVARPSGTRAGPGESVSLTDIAGSAWAIMPDVGIVVQRQYARIPSGEYIQTPRVSLSVETVRHAAAGALGSAELKWESSSCMHVESKN